MSEIMFSLPMIIRVQRARRWEPRVKEKHFHSPLIIRVQRACRWEP